MNIYEMLVNRALNGGGGGGGGSSDFSTAQVTITASTTNPDQSFNIVFPAIMNDPYYPNLYAENVGMTDAMEFTVPMYKGEAVGTVWAEFPVTVSSTGDVEVIGEGTEYYIYIRGNCTITVVDA